LCAIAHWGGRSSIPETSTIEPKSRGVLDAPPSRGMTNSINFRRHCEERSDEAIHLSACRAMDCFAALAMTARERCRWKIRSPDERSDIRGRCWLRPGCRFAHPGYEGGRNAPSSTRACYPGCPARRSARRSQTARRFR
jgi:hypothetical protein